VKFSRILLGTWPRNHHKPLFDHELITAEGNKCFAGRTAAPLRDFSHRIAPSAAPPTIQEQEHRVAAFHADQHRADCTSATCSPQNLAVDGVIIRVKTAFDP